MSTWPASNDAGLFYALRPVLNSSKRPKLLNEEHEDSRESISSYFSGSNIVAVEGAAGCRT